MTGVQTCALPICFPVTIRLLGYNAKFLEEVAGVFHKPGDMVVCYYENRERAMMIEHEETEMSLLMPVRLPNVPEKPRE